MNYLLDTCVISELVRQRPEPNVVEWIRQQNEETLYLSALSLGEIQKGIVKAPDPKRREKLQNWLDQDLQRRFSNRILDVSSDVAIQWGQLQGQAEKIGRMMPVIDGLLTAAAAALHAGMAIVTRNIQDFESSGVQVVNPWPPVSSE